MHKQIEAYLTVYAMFPLALLGLLSPKDLQGATGRLVLLVSLL